MRTKIDPNNKDLFRLRLEEKEAQRDELLVNDDSEAAREHRYKHFHEKRERIKVGKPEFRPRFR